MRRAILITLLVSAVGFAADDYFSQWLNGPVKLIMTDDEANTFEKLQTPEAKFTFTRIFWARRDPDPDTLVNEFRVEFERRVAYANEKFAVGSIPGWKTAMGQIYVIWGPPLRTEQKLMDSTRVSLWWYGKLKLPQMDPNEAFMFVELHNDSRMYLLPPAPPTGGTLIDWAQRRAEIQSATLTNIPFRYVEASAVWNKRSIEKPELNYDDLLYTGKVSTEYQVKLITFSWDAGFSNGPTGKRHAQISVKIPIKEMSFTDAGGGVKKASMTLHVTVSDSKKEKLISVDGPIIVQKTQDELLRGVDSAAEHQVAFDIAPGSYQIELVLEDDLTLRVGYLTQSLAVPAGN